MKKRKAGRISVGKPEGKRPLVRPRRRLLEIIIRILERWKGMR
jgi:hypothetical protein